MKLVSIFLAVLTLLPAGLGIAAAQPASPLPAASLVVTGRVAGLESRWDAASGTIVTDVQVAVDRRLRGHAPDRIVLKQLGGRVGDIGLFVAGQAAFTVGEDALLLLAVDRRDGTLHTAGLGRGKLAADAATIAAVETAIGGGAATARGVAAPAGGDPPMTPAFAHLPTDGGPPARWHEVDDGGRVFVDHPSGLPGGWSGSTANATAAIDLWRNSGMDLDLRDGGASLSLGQCAATFTGNGRIAVSYNDPCDPGVPDSAETWVVGGGYYTTGDLRTVNGTEYQKFIQGFVVLNNGGPQAGSAGCFQDAITHGLGHALGLGHTDSIGAMMQALPRATCAAGPASLGADDITGVTTIYQGIPSGPVPPGAPTALTASAVLSTVTLNWTPAASGGPVQRHLVDAGTAPGVYNLGSASFNGSAPLLVFIGVPPGSYVVRVRAQNAAGTSAASNEAQVTVGACSLPGAPGTLSSSVTDTNVSLAWSAPTAGVVQGYRLFVGSAPGLANLVVQDVAPTVTALGAAGVPFGTYYARVAATNVCGVGPSSNEVTVVVQPCAGPPQAPTGLHFSSAGSFVALAWTAPATGPAPASYTMHVGSAPGASDLLIASTGSATTIGGVAPSGRYFVRVIAQNACGGSLPSNEIEVVVP